jgi:hypothetical protein
VSDPSPYDHYRPVDADYPDGVYRVVGTGGPGEDGEVRLLEVADADGRRVTTGRVLSVPREDLAGFEPAENPDAGFRPWQVVDGFVEELRMLVDWLRR